MPPLLALILVVAVTAGAWGAHVSNRRRRVAALRGLASCRGLQYFADDRFSLRQRVLAAMPLPGAADLSVYDILCRRGDGDYRYLFTIEYTAGTTGNQRRLRRAAALVEPADGPRRLWLGPEDLPLVSQYERLVTSEGEQA